MTEFKQLGTTTIADMFDRAAGEGGFESEFDYLLLGWERDEEIAGVERYVRREYKNGRKDYAYSIELMNGSTVDRQGTAVVLVGYLNRPRSK